MRESEVKENCMVWSKRFQCYGQTLAKKKYMILVLFVNYPSAWLHCAELCLDPRDPTNGDEKWKKQ